MKAIIFAGQGSQKVGMGKELVETSKAARGIFQVADEVTDGKISRVCFEGPQEELNLTVNTQPCVFTVGIAYMAAMEEKGIRADVTAGFSLGEYGALVCSRVLTFEDALRLVLVRGELMNECAVNNPGGMAAVLGMDDEKLVELCNRVDGYVVPVNYNCPGQTVVAGDKSAVEQLSKVITDNGYGKCIQLAVSGAFHSKHMEDAARGFEKHVESTIFQDPETPFISNVTGDFVKSGSELKELEVRQIHSPVLWEQSIRTAISFGADSFIEAGPGRTLTGLMRKIDQNVDAKTAEALLSDK